MADVWFLVKILCSPAGICSAGLFGPPYVGPHAKAECLRQADINDLGYRSNRIPGGWGCQPDLPSPPAGPEVAVKH